MAAGAAFRTICTRVVPLDGCSSVVRALIVQARDQFPATAGFSLSLFSSYLVITSNKKVFLPKTSTCRDGTKPDGNNTTIRPHHPYILCRFANSAHHKTLCTLAYQHPIHNPHFAHTNTALHSPCRRQRTCTMLNGDV